MTITAWWWRGTDHSAGHPNVGDELTPYILSKVLGDPVEFAHADVADCFCVGSICPTYQDDELVSKRATPLKIIGSGLMYPVPAMAHPMIDYRLVRGYLTQMCLPGYGEGVPVGDPGLLMSRVYPLGPTGEIEIGVIPHHGAFDDFGSCNLPRECLESAVTFIDPRTDDVEDFCRQIVRCKRVLSQSLHGLVLAKSYGIEAEWWGKPLSIENGGKWKFYDYQSAFRPLHPNQYGKTLATVQNDIHRAILEAFE